MNITEVLTSKNELENISAIYKIENKANGKFYIGKAENIGQRWEKGHIDKLNTNKHENKKIQSDWKSGQWDFSILEESDNPQIKEIKYIYEAYTSGQQIYNDVNNKLIIQYHILKLIKANGFKFRMDYKTPTLKSDKGKELIINFRIVNPSNERTAIISFTALEFANEPKNIRSAEIKQEWCDERYNYRFFNLTYGKQVDEMTAKFIVDQILEFLTM